MKWFKRGIVWRTPGVHSWSMSHAMGPTPFVIDSNTIRIFLTTLDADGCGRPMFVDVSADDPMDVMRVSSVPILDIGQPGSFDDNGLMATCVIESRPGTLFMYYAGFEICKKIRYRILTGLAVSKNGGESFVRLKTTPVLERSDSEAHFRCGPFAMLDDEIYKLWYVAGSDWARVNGKLMPIYELRYQESKDGVLWKEQGEVSMPLTGSDEHGFGRPWVIKRGDKDYQLFYSIRRRSLGAYRLGYAESTDGISWVRKDQEMGLDVSADGFDSSAIMYSAVVCVQGRTYCFYNGNNFGESGFGVAELIE